MSSELLEELREEFRSLTMEELSGVSGLAAWRLRELVKGGKGPPHFRVGMTYRFPVSGVREWYAGLSSKNGPSAKEARRSKSKKC